MVSNSMAASVQGLEAQENKKPISSVAHSVAHSVAEHMDAIPENAPSIEAHTGEPHSHVSGNDPMMFPGILAREHRNNSSRNLAQSG
jgi:AMP deaminase